MQREKKKERNENETEYMPANEREVGVTAKLQEAEAVKVDEFKYPGSTIKSKRGEEESASRLERVESRKFTRW